MPNQTDKRDYLLLSIPKACKEIGISRHKLTQAFDDGLRYHYVGGHRRTTLQWLKDYIGVS